MPANTQGEPDRRQFLRQCLGGAVASAAFGLGVRAPSRDEPPAQRAGPASDDEQFWSNIRRQFPLAADLAYFNAGGLGPSPQPVIDALLRETTALEHDSETGHERVAAVREKLSAFLNCAPEELALTRNSTEGMNLVARGLSLRAGDEILMTTHEHPGGAMPWLGLAKDTGVRVNLVEPGDGGDDTLARITGAVTPRTRVVAVSHILCTTGLCLPARQIAELCRERGLICVLDGAQAVGMVPVDLHALGCDFYVSSGHKWLLGPKGTGLLYIRAGARDLWRPTNVGAHSDCEYDLDRKVLEFRTQADVTEYGTRNTALLLALGAAVDFLNGIGMERVAQRGRSLALYLRQRLQVIPGIEILTPAAEEASASIITFATTGSGGDVRDWAPLLQKQYRIRPRPVSEHGLRGLRISAHVYNTYAEVDRLVVALSELAKGTRTA